MYIATSDPLSPQYRYVLLHLRASKSGIIIDSLTTTLLFKYTLQWRAKAPRELPDTDDRVRTGTPAVYRIADRVWSNRDLHKKRKQEISLKLFCIQNAVFFLQTLVYRQCCLYGASTVVVVKVLLIEV